MLVLPAHSVLVTWIETCVMQYQTELLRAPDPDGLASYIERGCQGFTVADQLMAIQSSPEWHALHDTPPPPLVTGVTIDGTTFRVVN
jgi:hypothetical protein